MPTRSYAGKESRDDFNGTDQGPTLGTMMTISGAAISPNWGYHSSPATAFVMTLFNVRLGAWLPNPAVAEGADLQLAKPRNSLKALGSELIGETTDTSQAVYLSDGGHFDNLGLYEMLHRRCRHVLVIDAGQDGDCNFFDLGNAIRKAAIDFNIHIEMQQPVRIYSRRRTEKAGSGTRNALGFAQGKITYPDAPDGHLIYLKPSWLDGMPADARAYGLSNAAFPHVSTVDQWFTESEFESYRTLGEWQTQQLVDKLNDLKLQPELTSLFTAASALKSAIGTA